MSKGSKKCTFRIPHELEGKIAGEIISHNYYSKGSPWNMTDFIIKAIEEKIAHATRSRQKKPKRVRVSLVTQEEVETAKKIAARFTGVGHPALETSSQEKGGSNGGEN